MSTRVRPCVFCFALLALCSNLLLSGCGSAASISTSTNPLKSRTLTSITIAPATTTITAGQDLQLTATGSFDDDSTGPIPGSIHWSASTIAASVNAAGWLQAYDPGHVVITANSGGIVATTQLDIAAPTSAPVAATYTTHVSPSAGDDLAGPCFYDLLLQDSSEPVKGIWVIYDRPDSSAIWGNSGLRALALRFHLGLIFAYQCNAASYPDIQSDGRKGPARTLSTALTQFATLSSHPEVASAKLALFGFSAAGVLSLTTAETMPARILTIVTYDAGSAPLELRQLTPSSELEGIPILMLGSGADNMAGTSMSQQYFLKGRAAGAPWAFAVQPGVGHCCNAYAAPILVAWTRSVIPLRQSPTDIATAVDPALGGHGTYTCTPDGVTDGRGYTDCQFTAAAALTSPQTPNPTAAWLPDPAFAEAWLSWTGITPP